MDVRRGNYGWFGTAQINYIECFTNRINTKKGFRGKSTVALNKKIYLPFLFDYLPSCHHLYLNAILKLEVMVTSALPCVLKRLKDMFKIGVCDLKFYFTWLKMA